MIGPFIAGFVAGGVTTGAFIWYAGKRNWDGKLKDVRDELIGKTEEFQVALKALKMDIAAKSEEVIKDVEALKDVKAKDMDDAIKTIKDKVGKWFS